MQNRCLFKICMIMLAICLMSFRAPADIYKFVDSNGIAHFTNVPTSSNYKLFIRERPAKRNKFHSSNRSKFDSLIKKASRRFGVDFPLLKAVIQVESDFNPHAVSSRGAKGLMQIMPGNLKKLYVSNPFDPSQNIMGGALHLKNLMTHYNGRIPLALAAYNAGVNVVDRYNTIPPFRETLEYVRKVMKLYNAYNGRGSGQD